MRKLPDYIVIQNESLSWVEYHVMGKMFSGYKLGDFVVYKKWPWSKPTFAQAMVKYEEDAL